MSDLYLIKELEGEIDISLTEETDIDYSRAYIRAYQLNDQEQVIKLAINELELAFLPGIILLFKELQYLSLYNGQLSSVPDSIGNLTNLTELFLDNNRLSSVPDSIGNLTNLTELNLSGNQLSIVPDSIGNLTNLTELNLSGNQLNSVPDSIGNLTNLTELNLSGNQLSSVPDSIGNLTNLTVLYLDNNQLSSVSDSIGNLTNLARLELDNNQLSSVPDSIGNLTNLLELYLFVNQLSSVPATIGNLKNNCLLDISKNPLLTPPLEIATGEDNVKKIRNYFAQLKVQQEDYLFEAKLLIVGEPGAGKTSMAFKLENKDCNLPGKEDTTRGIEVKQYYFPIRAEDFTGFPHPDRLAGRSFRLNLWDFGGQEIYKATHRFFLSKRSLYALVADSRNEDTDFNYWLHIVEMFGGESPLLIVLNEKHGRKRKLDMASMRKRFEHIKEFISVDLADDDHTRLNQLATTVRYHASKLPHIGNPVPANWTKVRDALERNIQNTITRQDYLNICKSNGIDKSEDALVLSQYFHDIGVFLHFQTDPVLKHIVFLKSNWATQAIYKVLDHNLLNEQNGRFHRKDAKTIWDAPEYFLLQDELLQLMKKFFLAYEIGETQEFIVPDRLLVEQPKYKWGEANNLTLRFDYDFFMPKGLMSQIIVELHSYIKNHDLVWGRGVVLERGETTAEIIETYDSRTIKIRVSGNNRRDFITIISETIEKVNGQYEKLHVDKLIPCNCDKCKAIELPHFFRHRKLMKRLNDRVDYVECDNSYERIHIRSLIDEVINPTRSTARLYSSSTTIAERKKVFVSYSHKDRVWLKRIQAHLGGLKREGISLDLWDDTKINAGDSWQAEIEKALAATKVAILLVSANFLNSEFITEIELPRLLKAAQDDGTVILPLIIKPCRLNKDLLEIQSVNSPAKPLSGLPENAQDEALVKLADRVAEILGGDE